MRRSLGVVLLVFGAFGCASTQTNLKKDMAVIERESSADRLTTQGEGYAALGDMTRAEQYFAAALKNGGDAGALARRLVAVCVADGRYPSALEHAEEHLRKHPGDTDMRFAVATLRDALGDTDGAREELRAVARLRPGLAEAHFALGALEKQHGNLVEADAAFRAYLAAAPNGEHAEEARAGILQQVGPKTTPAKPSAEKPRAAASKKVSRR
jgi:tetratricopeptide (TPR) repeat protein